MSNVGLVIAALTDAKPERPRRRRLVLDDLIDEHLHQRRRGRPRDDVRVRRVVDDQRRLVVDRRRAAGEAHLDLAVARVDALVCRDAFERKIR